MSGEPARPAGLRRLESTAALRALMTEYYLELEAAARSEEAPVAWCTSVGPVELLRAFGFRVYFPENHAALIGASRLAGELIPAATAAGYSPEICSYLTSDVGAWLLGRTPLSRAYGLERPPRPDVLVYNTNQCRDVQDWFSFYARELDVPLLGLHTPRAVGAVTPAHVGGMIAQVQALLVPLEQISGARLDAERLREVVASSRRTSELWGRVLRSAAARPAPLTFFDATIQMGPAVVLRGDPRAERYYRALLEELEGRVRAGVGAVPGERVRLYWEGMPIWGKLRELSEHLAGLGVCVVASTYCGSWVFDALAHPEPLEAMARAYCELFIVRDEAFKEEHLAAEAEAYGVDGFVYHDAKTCPNNSNTRYGLPERLAQRLGLPRVVIHGDLSDLRLYSEEQARTQLEALVEQIVEARGGAPGEVRP